MIYLDKNGLTYFWGKIKTRVSASQPKTYTATMTSSGWSGLYYSFESSYPVAQYDIEIEPNGESITEAQLDAWSKARIVGSPTANRVKAMGDVPTVSIPIIVRAVKK